MRIQVSQGHAWITVSDLKRDWFLREGHGIDLPAGSIVVIEAARRGDVGYRLVESLQNQWSARQWLLRCLDRLRTTRATRLARATLASLAPATRTDTGLF